MVGIASPGLVTGRVAAGVALVRDGELSILLALPEFTEILIWDVAYRPASRVFIVKKKKKKKKGQVKSTGLDGVNIASRTARESETNEYRDNTVGYAMQP